jgi:hypothetical protein
MGIYYAYANDSKKEIIFPMIDDGESVAGSKKHNFMCRDHPIHFLLCVALMYRWCGDSVRLCNDYNDEDIYFEYKDVTCEVVKIANEKAGMNFTYRINSGE